MTTPWSAAECHSVFDLIWREGGAPCPQDGSPLVAQIAKALGGSYTVFAHCRRCGGGLQMTRADDPMSGRFRDWTDAEKIQIADAVLDDRFVECPVDGTPLTKHRTPDGRGSIVMASCFRCQRKHQDRFPRS